MFGPRRGSTGIVRVAPRKDRTGSMNFGWDLEAPAGFEAESECSREQLGEGTKGTLSLLLPPCLEFMLPELAIIKNPSSNFVVATLDFDQSAAKFFEGSHPASRTMQKGKLKFLSVSVYGPVSHHSPREWY